MTISLTKSGDGKWVDEEFSRINLPPRSESGAIEIVDLASSQSTVFVGANGAGKSRMASWVDQKNPNTLYIRARRDVLMPNSYSITPENTEYSSVLAGQKLNITDYNQAKNFRNRSNNDKFGDNDYQHILNLLGSRHATSALKFKLNYDSKSPPAEATKSDLDIAVEIWSKVLPHLVIDSSTAPELKVARRAEAGKWYAPQEMSDGEKAIFYLVGKCLIAPPGSTLIIDEPEMFVHPSVRNRLWNNVEMFRSDCRFVYFTHDLAFVRSRKYRHVFVVKSYSATENEFWEYSEFVSTDEENEKLQISVWGSRQPTLLVEGTATSLDIRLLSLAYPEFAIEPAGSCDQVISGVAALRAQSKFHHQDVFGLIDPDFRSDAEVRSLRSKGVNSLKFREIENVLVSTAVISEFLKRFGMGAAEVEETIQKFVSPLRERFKSRAKSRATEFAKRDILNHVEEVLASNTEFDSKLDLSSSGKIQQIIEAHHEKIQQASIHGDWDSLLRYFSVRKDDFGGTISQALSLKDYGAYRDAILRILNTDSEEDAKIRKAVVRNLPQISFSPAS